MGKRRYGIIGELEMLMEDVTLGRRSMHVQKHECSSCGYPAAKTRKCMLLPLPAPYSL